MTILSAGLKAFSTSVSFPFPLNTISPSAVINNRSFVSLPYYKNLPEKISKLHKSIRIFLLDLIKIIVFLDLSYL